MTKIKKYDVYYPDGDFKCRCDSYEEAKNESKGYSVEDIDIREVYEENDHPFLISEDCEITKQEMVEAILDMVERYEWLITSRPIEGAHGKGKDILRKLNIKTKDDENSLIA